MLVKNVQGVKLSIISNLLAEYKTISRAENVLVKTRWQSGIYQVAHATLMLLLQKSHPKYQQRPRFSFIKISKVCFSG